MKCIVFSRVSTANQSLDSQTDIVMNEAIKLGYSPDNIITIEDKESTVKLSKEERTGINKLLHEPDVECVIIYELSRLSRRPKELYELRDYFLQHNIQLICLTPYFKLINNGQMDMMANIVFGLFSSMAENECILRAERCRRGREKAKENHQYIGGGICFGYELHCGKIEMRKSEADVVKFIYEHNYLSLNQLTSVCLTNGLIDYNKFASAYCMVRRILSYENIYKGNDPRYPAII